jgi:hypothetical protein
MTFKEIVEEKAKEIGALAKSLAAEKGKEII